MSQLTIDTNFDESNSPQLNKPIKKYNYLMEKQTLKHITNIEILSNNHNIYGDSMLNILCYHVTQNSKYPFIQFGLEKLPYCNDIIPEQLFLPYIKINHDTIDDCSTIIIEKMNNLLSGLGCKCNLSLDSFQGVISGSDGRLYALVDISNINIFRLQISRESPIWFSLPTEIINIRSICNIPIDDRVTDLFLDMPELGVLNYYQSIDTYDKTFPLPDAVYSGSYFRKTEFRSVFSMEKEQVYESCGEYYYFFRLFEDAVKEGGWVRQGGYKLIDLDDTSITHTPSGIKHIDNKYGRYEKGGINRYALFPENYIMYNESNKTLSLTDDDINTQFTNNQCIIIQYLNDELDTIMPDILVKEYESAFPISYHMLHKSLLGDKYEVEKQDKYMIL
jgi:hypothetical protein